MEDLAIGTKVYLEGQGEQIESIDRQFYAMNSDIGLTSRLSTAIAGQRSRNKYLLWAVYALVFLCLFYILSSVFSWLSPLDKAEVAGALKPSGLTASKNATDTSGSSPSDPLLNNL